MNIVGRIKRSMANRNDNVFVRAEFEPFGSSAQVSRAINELQSSGQLVKLGLGVYAKAKMSRLSGRPIPVRPLEELAPEALEKLGVDVQPSRLMRAYNSGKSTQVPVGVVINTGQRRITRQLGFNGASVKYERV